MMFCSLDDPLDSSLSESLPSELTANDTNVTTSQLTPDLLRIEVFLFVGHLRGALKSASITLQSSVSLRIRFFLRRDFLLLLVITFLVDASSLVRTGADIARANGGRLDISALEVYRVDVMELDFSFSDGGRFWPAGKLGTSFESCDVVRLGCKCQLSRHGESLGNSKKTYFIFRELVYVGAQVLWWNVDL